MSEIIITSLGYKASSSVICRSHEITAISEEQWSNQFQKDKLIPTLQSFLFLFKKPFHLQLSQ